jgi:hypothetical protein
MTDWQLTQPYKAKFDLIYPHIKACKNVLDIGCNAGEITRLCGNKGMFAVGVDQKISCRVPENACIGETVITLDNINTLPNFDAILLLSVLHQLIVENGHDYARDYVARLTTKAKNGVIIEIAAISSKYGKYKVFEDNDYGSIRNWFVNWLPEFLQAEYIGKAPHNRDDEPFRYLFKVYAE